MKTLPGYQEATKEGKPKGPGFAANASKEHHSDVCVAVSIEHKEPSIELHAKA